MAIGTLEATTLIRGRAMTTVLPSPELIASFVDIVGPGNALTAPADTAPYLVESRGLYRGTTAVRV